MPGATTARLVLLAAAIALKLRMMPQTVPNSPMNGAAEPSVARNGSRYSSNRNCSAQRQPHRALDAVAALGEGLGNVPSCGHAFIDSGGDHRTRRLAGIGTEVLADQFLGAAGAGCPIDPGACRVAGGAQPQPLVDDDRPAPYRAEQQQQQQQHRLHHDVGMREQPDHR